MSVKKLNEEMLDKVGIIKSMLPSKRNKQYYVIYWPDGSIRWVFNVSGMTPGFLAFYPSITVRARLGAAIMRLVGLFGLMGFFAEKIDFLKLEENSLIFKALEKYQCDGWALFAGTPGIDRKIVISICRGNNIIKYIKVPISTQSQKLIGNELRRLKQLDNLKLKSVIVPNAEKLEDALVLENVYVVSDRTPNKLCSVHLRGLAEIYEKTCKRMSLKQFVMNNDLVARFQLIEKSIPRDHRVDVDKVRNIANSALKHVTSLLIKSGDRKIDLCFSHRDFTPWNSFVSGNTLVLIDLELSEYDAPIGFDICHYIIQTMLMLDGLNSMRAKEKVFELVSRCVDDCYQGVPKCNKLIIFLYVIKQAVDYLPKYIEQSEVHQQVFEQIEYWNLVMSEGWE